MTPARRHAPRPGAWAALVAVAAGVALATPAHAADRVLTTVARSDSIAAGASVTTIDWRLPAGAAVGDVIAVDLAGRHASSVLAPEVLTAASGSALGDIVLGDDGVLRITLTAVGTTEADREGSLTVTTAETQNRTTTPGRAFTGEADAVVFPGERPGTVFEPADRAEANKWGQWTDDTEARLRWVVETPAGPWQSVTVTDAARPGQRVDCTTLVVRSTSAVDPDTGYLLDLVAIDAARTQASCTAEGVEVSVIDIAAGEIVEISFEAVAENPEQVGDPARDGYANTALVSGVEPPSEAIDRSRASLITQTITPPSGVPEAPGEPEEPDTPVTPETPTTPENPTPPPASATPPPASATPPPASATPPPALATTGADVPVAFSAGAAALLAAVGAALLIAARRQRGAS